MTSATDSGISIPHAADSEIGIPHDGTPTDSGISIPHDGTKKALPKAWAKAETITHATGPVRVAGGGSGEGAACPRQRARRRVEGL